MNVISQITSVVCTVLSAFLDGCSSKRLSSQLPPPPLSFSDDNFPCITHAGPHILAVHCQVFQISINTPYSAVASALKQEIGFHDICYSNIHRMQYLSGYYSKLLIDKCVYVHSYQKPQLLIFKKKRFSTQF